MTKPLLADATVVRRLRKACQDGLVQRGWLAEHAIDDMDRARLIGYEDALRPFVDLIERARG